MRRAEHTPIDDDAENAEIRPLEACIPCQFRVRLLERIIAVLACVISLRDFTAKN